MEQPEFRESTCYRARVRFLLTNILAQMSSPFLVNQTEPTGILGQKSLSNWLALITNSFKLRTISM